MVSLDSFEQTFSKQIAHIELLAEINITFEDVEQLRQCVADFMKADDVERAAYQLEYRYPAALVMFLVTQGMYGYQDGDYWSSVASVTKIDTNTANRWGRFFEDTLRAWKKPLFPNLGGRRYVDRILLHGGIPDYCLPDFFEHMLRPALVRPDLMALDTDELIADWLTSESLRFATDKPVLRFLEHGGALASNFVARCLDMARQYQDTGVLPYAIEAGLPERVVAKYGEWIHQRDAWATQREVHVRLQKPQLWFDPDGDGILLDLPSQILPVGTSALQAIWQVTAGDFVETYEVYAWRRGSDWETEAQRIPLDIIAEEYIVSFEGDQNVQRQWRFPGVRHSTPVLAFDAQTGHLIPWRAVLPTRELWLIYPTHLAVTADDGQFRGQIDHVPGIWASYTAQCWALQKARTVHIGTQSIAVEPDVGTLRPQLVGGQICDQIIQTKSLTVYVGGPPDIHIPLLAHPEQELERWRIRIRDAHGQIRTHTTLTNLHAALSVEGDSMRLDLKKIGLTPTTFGIFTITMRGPLGRDATFPIALLPALTISGHEQVRLPDKHGHHADVDLLVETSPDVAVSCDDSNIELLAVEQGATGLLIPSEHTQIRIRISKGHDTIPLSIALPILRWSIRDDHGVHLESSGFQSHPVAWLQQLQSPRLTVSLVPAMSMDRPLSGYLQVYYRPEKALQRLQPRGGGRQHWMQFYLGEAADSIRSSPEPSALYELVLEQLPGTTRPQAIPLLRITKHLAVEHFSCQGMYQQDQCLLMIRWRGVQPLNHRCLRLWSQWRPWEAPIELAISDTAEREQRWAVPAHTIPPGAYWAEMTIHDPWASNGAQRPFLPGSSCTELIIGRRPEQLSYLYQLPETVKGLLEHSLASPDEHQYELLSMLPAHMIDEDLNALLATLLEYYRRPAIAEQIAAQAWRPLAAFHYLSRPAELLQALLHFVHHIDSHGLVLLEDALQSIAPKLTTLFFRGMREHAIALCDIEQVLGMQEHAPRKPLIAQLASVGIQVRVSEDKDQPIFSGSLLDELYLHVSELMLTDGVRMYLHQIGQFSLLRADQEQELARCIADGIAAQQELSYTDDIIHRRTLVRRIEIGATAREALINANLRLVVSIAKKYLYRMPLEDLIQEGNIGLLRAVERFDVALGHKFSTYATWWIRQAITRGIADKERTIRLPVHMIETVNRINRERSRLLLRLGREPGNDELADACNIPIEKLRKAIALSQDILSLEMPVGEDTESTLGDMLEIPDEISVDEIVIQKELEQQTALLLHHLSERERMVICMRYGLEGGQKYTLEEIGQLYGVTRERIRQIEAKVLKRLRYLENTRFFEEDGAHAQEPVKEA